MSGSSKMHEVIIFCSAFHGLAYNTGDEMAASSL